MIAGRFRFPLIAGVVLLCAAAIVFVIWIGATSGETKTMQARQDLPSIYGMLEQFRKDHGRYPMAEESLEVLIDPAPGGKYFVAHRAVVDPWGHSYIYRPPGGNVGAPAVYSAGPNGVDDGGHGDDVVMSTMDR